MKFSTIITATLIAFASSASMASIDSRYGGYDANPYVPTGSIMIGNSDISESVLKIICWSPMNVDKESVHCNYVISTKHGIFTINDSVGYVTKSNGVNF